MTPPESPTPAAGTQTLARGLLALELVAGTPGGLTVAEVSEALGVHRSIATRLLATIADFHLISRSPEGRYRAAGGLTALARDVYAGLRELATPTMQTLADEVGVSVALFVNEGNDAVALKVVEPAQALVRVSYREGSRHPLDRGAAGYALQAALPATAGESERVTEARAARHVLSHGEVMPDYWGLGVPIAPSDQAPAACLNLITASEEALREAVAPSIRAAAALQAQLGA